MPLANLVNWAVSPDTGSEKKSGCDCGGKKNPGSCASACGCKDGQKNNDSKKAGCAATGSCGAGKKAEKSDKKGPCSPGSCAPGSCAGAPKQGAAKSGDA